MTDFQATLRPAYVTEESQASLLRSVFGWMSLGLITTALVSLYVLNTPVVTQKILNPGTLILLAFVELGLVLWLSARVMKMSGTTATAVFLAYSALNGISLSPLALVYTGESLTSTFMVTAGLFGSMALYGYVTKRNLASMGSFLMMGLWGVLLASIVNLFFHSSSLGFALSCIGVIVFTGLTAYDVNTIRNYGAQAEPGTESFRRVAIIGALRLYLDFINLFLMLVRFLGNTRNN